MSNEAGKREISGEVCGWRNGEVFVKVKTDQYLARIGDKVTIHCELPPMKIEISEKEFDEAWLSAVGTTWDQDREALRQKLFGRRDA